MWTWLTIFLLYHSEGSLDGACEAMRKAFWTIKRNAIWRSADPFQHSRAERHGCPGSTVSRLARNVKLRRPQSTSTKILPQRGFSQQPAQECTKAAFLLAEKTVLEMELTCSPPQSNAATDHREKKSSKKKVERWMDRPLAKQNEEIC